MRIECAASESDRSLQWRRYQRQRDDREKVKANLNRFLCHHWNEYIKFLIRFQCLKFNIYIYICVCVCVCIKRVRERLQRAANLILNDPAGFAVGERERERVRERRVKSTGGKRRRRGGGGGGGRKEEWILTSQCRLWLEECGWVPRQSLLWKWRQDGNQCNTDGRSCGLCGRSFRNSPWSRFLKMCGRVRACRRVPPPPPPPLSLSLSSLLLNVDFWMFDLIIWNHFVKSWMFFFFLFDGVAGEAK